MKMEAASEVEEPQRNGMRSRQSSLRTIQTVALEAIAPRSLSQEDEAGLSPRASLLADLAFTDGTLSLQRLSRRLSRTMGRNMDETSIGIRDSEVSSPPSKRSSLPPPPPPPVELTDEVQAAIDAASQRRASVGSKD